MVTPSPLSPETRSAIAALLFPDAEELPKLSALEQKYPPRPTAPTALITRVAPSPTGMAHIGLVYTSLVNRMLAHQTGGAFLLRIEDTDSNREIQGAFDAIVQTLHTYGLDPDEGMCYAGQNAQESRGAYGPYVQSQRKSIYRAIAHHLVVEGLAYPCFCNQSELEQIGEQQRLSRTRPGYYGRWARWRDANLETIKAELDKGAKPVIRLRSFGSSEARVTWEDSIKGALSLPENDLDSVILKSDGQSLYHLAHMVDDHYMRITTVVRGDEWVSSVPLHLQLYKALGWTPPTFGHLATIQTTDTVEEIDEETGEKKTKVIKRKLSKRKDPEAQADFYLASGFPIQAVCEYLLNIANSSFEDWRRQNPLLPLTEYVLRLNKFGAAGALADTVKLTDISKEYISRLSAQTVFDLSSPWLARYDEPLMKLFEAHKALVIKALGVERGGPKPNKRIATWSNLRQELAWALPELFAERAPCANELKISADDQKGIVTAFLETFSLSDDRDTWFAKCKVVASQLGFAPEVKQFKADPSAFKGHVGDVTMVLRVSLCRSQQSPDLHEVMQVLGVDEVRRRLTA